MGNISKKEYEESRVMRWTTEEILHTLKGKY